MTTTFQFTVPDDFTSLPSGSNPDLAQLREALLAPASGITVQLAQAPSQAGNVVTIAWKLDLSAAEEAAQSAVIAAHVPVAVATALPVQLEQKVGGLPTLLDGVAVEGGPDAWIHADLALEESLHVGGSVVVWDGAQFGDYGFAVLCIAPPVPVSPLAVVPISATSFAIAPPLAALFDPATSGAQLIEFWDAGMSNLLEIRPIASVDTGSGLITLAEPTSNAHAIDGQLIPLAGTFSPLRGPHNLSGGTRLFGSHAMEISNIGELTALLPPGLTLGIRIRTVSTAGTRRVACNYKLRPAAS